MAPTAGRSETGRGNDAFGARNRDAETEPYLANGAGTAEDFEGLHANNGGNQTAWLG